MGRGSGTRQDAGGGKERIEPEEARPEAGGPIQSLHELNCKSTAQEHVGRSRWHSRLIWLSFSLLQQREWFATRSETVKA